MEVIILAGGLGTRLRSVVSEVPKCMAPISDKPFLWYLLKYLTRFDISRVVLSVGYLKEVIFNWIETCRSEFPFVIDYSVEESPLGTGGGIKLALSKILSKEAIILNGDTFFDVDLNLLLKTHQKQMSANITIALKTMEKFDRYGTVEADGDGKILQFNEKKPCKRGVINGGIYIINKKATIFEDLPEKFSFETKVLQKYCGEKGSIYGVIQEGYFIDIGVPEDYIKANIELK